MRKPGRHRIATLVAVAVLAGILTTNFVVAQQQASQEDSAGLQSLVLAASSARAYGQETIRLAASNGIDVSSETSLIASGNSSLLIAMAALSPGGNLAEGTIAVHAAMGNFTAAAARAGASLLRAGLIPSEDLQGDLAAVSNLNDSLLRLSSVINKTCASTTVSSASASQFVQACSAANSSIANATLEMKAAGSYLASVEAGAPEGSAGEFANIVSTVTGDISSANAELLTLASFTYASRAEVYASGTLASQIVAANSSAKLQGTLLRWYEADLSSYQTFSTSQAAATKGVTTSASELASTITSVSISPVTTSVADQQATLIQVVLSNLTLFSQQVASLSLPMSIVTRLQSNVSAAENSLSAYNSALSALSSSTTSFSTVKVGGFSNYATSFYSAGNLEAMDAGAFATSLAGLKSYVETLAGEFPMIYSLGTWETTLSQLATKVSAGQSSVSSSFQSAYTSMQAVNSGITSLTTQVQSVAKVDVSSVLLQNVSSIYSSESSLLNSTALSSLLSASVALQSDAQLGSALIASSQALSQTSMGAFSGAAESLIAQGSSLGAQAQATSSSMAATVGYLTADLSARTQDIASAMSLISQALVAFDAQQVARGSGLLAQASTLLAVASSKD